MTKKSLSGRFELPGDKSISHRLALLGAIAEGETRVHNYSTAADCSSTLACLAALGVELRREGTTVTLLGRGPEGFRPAPSTLDAGNSGSTIRMLAGVLAGRPFRSVLGGDASLCRRPVERVAVPLRAMGASVETREGKPPLAIEGGRLAGIEWRLPVASAQVKTAVLLAGLQADGTTTVREPGRSRDHTERLLPVFSVPVQRLLDGARVEGGARPRAVPDIEVPGDPSSAAFLVVAALVLPGSEVRIDNVLLNPTRIGFLEVLREMGAEIETGTTREDPEPVGWIRARASALSGVAVGPEQVPGLVDELPALAVAAAYARGRFTVSGASELRVKESDRISAIVEGLSRMGAAVVEHPDGFSIEGGRTLHGAQVRSFGDHRIAMALVVAGLGATGPTQVEGDECVAVSFPEFFDLVSRAR